jgi:hypothetical protein
VKYASSINVSISDIKQLLFKPGDQVIFAHTPTNCRVGVSPLKSASRSPRVNRQAHQQLFSPSAATATYSIAQQTSAAGPSTPHQAGSLLASPLMRTHAVTPASRHIHSTPLPVHMSRQSQMQTPLMLGSKSASTASYLASTNKSNTFLPQQTAEEPIDTADVDVGDCSMDITVGSRSVADNPSVITFGHSVANGWRGSMEDRVSVSCPLTITILDPSGETGTQSTADINPYTLDIGVFAVIDGHDGAGAATFLQTNIPSCVSAVATQLIHDFLNSQVRSLSQTGPAADLEAQSKQVLDSIDENAVLWRKILTVACEKLEDLLSKQPMMAIKITPPGYCLHCDFVHLC